VRLPEEEAEEGDERGETLRERGGRVLSVCAVVLVLVALCARSQRNGRQQWLSAIISAFPDSGLRLRSSLASSLLACYHSAQLAAASSQSQLWSLPPLSASVGIRWIGWTGCQSHQLTALGG
jgi:hypothetical protein